jgi:general secretion pathway protein L
MQVQLPPVRQKQQLHKIVAALVEDRVLQDLEQLHIVLPPDAAQTTAQGGTLMVAICHKDWLRQALAPLQAAGLQIQRLVPELTPSASPVLHLIESEQQAQCWLTHSQGVTLLPPNTHHWHAFGVDPTTISVIKAEPALSPTVEQHFARPAQLVSSAQRWLQATQSPWDLAQGEWAQAGWSQWVRWLQQNWRLLRYDSTYHLARVGLVSCVLIYVLGLNAVAWRESQRTENQKAQLSQILKHTFPSVQLVIDAPLQMQREVDTLAQSKGGLLFNDFEPLLSSVSALLNEHQKISRIDYATHQLKLQGLTLTPDQISESQQKLSSRGLSLQVDGTQGVIISAGVAQ